MIKMVISDLDGTLLQNHAQELSKEMIPLIYQLKELGILFVAASGRQLSNIQRLFGEAKDEIAYICENGAAAVYKGEVLYQDSFPKGVANEILQVIREKEGVEMTASALDTYYLEPKTEKYLNMLKNNNLGAYTILKEGEKLPDSCMKMAVYEEDGAELHFDFWKNRFQDQCKVVTSGYAWIDFVPFGTSKGKGIEKIMKILRITPEECVAFGDEYNDIEMLESVTYSFAMENAKEGVKEKAKYLTPRVEPVLEKIIKYKGNMVEVLEDE